MNFTHKKIENFNFYKYGYLKNNIEIKNMKFSDEDKKIINLLNNFRSLMDEKMIDRMLKIIDYKYIILEFLRKNTHLKQSDDFVNFSNCILKPYTIIINDLIKLYNIVSNKQLLACSKQIIKENEIDLKKFSNITDNICRYIHYNYASLNYNFFKYYIDEFTTINDYYFNNTQFVNKIQYFVEKTTTPLKECKSLYLLYMSCLVHCILVAPSTTIYNLKKHVLDNITYMEILNYINYICFDFNIYKMYTSILINRISIFNEKQLFNFFDNLTSKEMLLFPINVKFAVEKYEIEYICTQFKENKLNILNPVDNFLIPIFSYGNYNISKAIDIFKNYIITKNTDEEDFNLSSVINSLNNDVTIFNDISELRFSNHINLSFPMHNIFQLLNNLIIGWDGSYRNEIITKMSLTTMIEKITGPKFLIDKSINLDNLKSIEFENINTDAKKITKSIKCLSFKRNELDSHNFSQMSNVYFNFQEYYNSTINNELVKLNYSEIKVNVNKEHLFNMYMEMDIILYTQLCFSNVGVFFQTVSELDAFSILLNNPFGDLDIYNNFKGSPNANMDTILKLDLVEVEEKEDTTEIDFNNIFEEYFEENSKPKSSTINNKKTNELNNLEKYFPTILDLSKLQVFLSKNNISKLLKKSALFRKFLLYFLQIMCLEYKFEIKLIDLINIFYEISIFENSNTMIFNNSENIIQKKFKEFDDDGDDDDDNDDDDNDEDDFSNMNDVDSENNFTKSGGGVIGNEDNNYLTNYSEVNDFLNSASTNSKKKLKPVKKFMTNEHNKTLKRKKIDKDEEKNREIKKIKLLKKNLMIKNSNYDLIDDENFAKTGTNKIFNEILLQNSKFISNEKIKNIFKNNLYTSYQKNTSNFENSDQEDDKFILTVPPNIIKEFNKKNKLNSEDKDKSMEIDESEFYDCIKRMFVILSKNFKFLDWCNVNESKFDCKTCGDIPIKNLQCLTVLYIIIIRIFKRHNDMWEFNEKKNGLFKPFNCELNKPNIILEILVNANSEYEILTSFEFTKTQLLSISTVQLSKAFRKYMEETILCKITENNENIKLKISNEERQNVAVYIIIFYLFMNNNEFAAIFQSSIFKSCSVPGTFNKFIEFIQGASNSGKTRLIESVRKYYSCLSNGLLSKTVFVNKTSEKNTSAGPLTTNLLVQADEIELISADETKKLTDKTQAMRQLYNGNMINVLTIATIIISGNKPFKIKNSEYIMDDGLKNRFRVMCITYVRYLELSYNTNNIIINNNDNYENNDKDNEENLTAKTNIKKAKILNIEDENNLIEFKNEWDNDNVYRSFANISIQRSSNNYPKSDLEINGDLFMVMEYFMNSVLNINIFNFEVVDFLFNGIIYPKNNTKINFLNFLILSFRYDFNDNEIENKKFIYENRILECSDANIDLTKQPRYMEKYKNSQLIKLDAYTKFLNLYKIVSANKGFTESGLKDWFDKHIDEFIPSNESFKVKNNVSDYLMNNFCNDNKASYCDIKKTYNVSFNLFEE